MTENTSVTFPRGFKATGNDVGLKAGKKDLAIVYSEIPAKTAAVFTKNVVKAAPVVWDQNIIKSGCEIQAILINSGNANACTGENGLLHAKISAKRLAEKLNIKNEEMGVFIASTGVIGVPLDIEKILFGIDSTYHKLGKSPMDGDAAAEAIMTTDTISKTASVEYRSRSGVQIKIGGMAKGSGMIHPNMGTMLAFITTDVNISRILLDKALKESIEDSYNMISIDGDTSTNDTVVILANGMAGNNEITEENEDYGLFKEKLHEINLSLSKQIVKDGEGACKLITVKLSGAKTKEDARILSKSIITSNLVKTAFFGEDANWGRILAAMGYSGVQFDPNKVSISFENGVDSIILMKDGKPLPFSEDLALKILKNEEIMVNAHLKEGSESAIAWGCDLSYDYVKINADYRT